ncbi:leucine-rich repeat domain, L domain-like protein, partial [Tanacetum coccineum]
YLKGNPEKGIHKVKQPKTFLEAFVDADWAKCLVTRKFVIDLDWDQVLPVKLFCDSQAAIKIAANPVFHERTKHLEIDLHFVREKILSGLIETQKISNAVQLADIFTKGLDKNQHENLVLKLGLVDVFQIYLSLELNGKRSELFATMVQKGYASNQNLHQYQWSTDAKNNYAYRERIHNSYIDRVLILWQGKVNEFSRTLGLVKTIDLSSNNLTGPIPDEVTTLHGLLVLGLSNNSLIGEIPRDIGQMAELLTLNLSGNMFSGKMPSSMSAMHSLNDLDVSYNNLSGRVPSSTQLQSFPPERVTGNVGLCGLPTTTKCLEDEDQEVPRVGDSKGDAESTGELQRWFYIGGATGFATAFWIACITSLLNRRLRHAFFHFHDSMKDRVYVKMVVFIARLQRVARA